MTEIMSSHLVVGTGLNKNMMSSEKKNMPLLVNPSAQRANRDSYDNLIVLSS